MASTRLLPVLLLLVSHAVASSAVPRLSKRIALTVQAHAAQRLRARAAALSSNSQGLFSQLRGAVTPAATGGPIKYWGGPIVAGNPTVNIYHIYYGSWPSGSGQDYIDNFVRSLSSDSGAQGSSSDPTVKGWWAITSNYYQSSSGAKKNVSSKVRLAGTTYDNYSYGKALTDNYVLSSKPFLPDLAIFPLSFVVVFKLRLNFVLLPFSVVSIAVVKSKIGSGKALAYDPHGIYVLLTSKDVTLSSGFCSQYCGWHTADYIGSSPFYYAFVGHHAQCPNSCGVKSTSPNGNPAIDATISTLAHEITEAATDPDVQSGWFDAGGEENGDLCAWSYGTTLSSNGYIYNMVGLNGMKFLVQQNWDSQLQKCVNQNSLPASTPTPSPSPPPPSPSPPPPTPSPPPTPGTTKMNCQCTCANGSSPMNCQCSCTPVA
ncbi:unnamed protein product [Closterium sp. NIES-54]